MVALLMADVTVGLTTVITLENTYGAHGAPGANVYVIVWVPTPAVEGLKIPYPLG